MLNRPTAAPGWSPARRLTQRLGALTGPSSTLLRFVLVAAMLAAVACVYLWQVNELSNIHDATDALQLKARQLEEKNVALAEQLAQWSAPDYVDKLSTERGYVAAPQHVITAPVDGETSQVAVAPSAAPAR
jgi:hypothetical protein